MPELPEVQTVLDGVADVLQGKSLTGLECYYPGTVIIDPGLEHDPFPAKLAKAERRGKYMILHLDSSACIIIHLRMTGKLVYEPQPDEPHKHERARIMLASDDALRFIDIRTFGKIILCKTKNLGKFMPDLGMEPLADEFDARYLERMLKNRKAPIKTLMLDQKLIAGLGNIYVNEILYRAKLNPTVPGGEIPLSKLKILAKETKEVLKEAISKNGTSISDFRNVDNKTGEFQKFLRVYQKETCPKGHPVSRIKQAQRSTYFCPVCQK